MDVASWLRELGLERYEPAFRENKIDAKILPKLTAEDLKDLGVSLVGDRRRLLDAILSLRRNATPTVSGIARTDSAATADDSSSSPRNVERRQLTIMFCDLVDSTALSARLDPEDMRDVLRAYHSCGASHITKSDGFVAKYMGDGILAYFGYPKAHEDDAERAIRCALSLVDAISTLRIGHDVGALQLRVGVATGVVVVGDLIGEGAAQEQGVVGQTPNLAARLQAIAAPGQVVISQSTRLLAGGMFEYQDLGKVLLKGLADSTKAWQVLGETEVESRFEAHHEAGLIPLVGRHEELDFLLCRWREVKEGQGRVILVSGEPGVGKSRLAVALQERLQPEQHTKLQYFCSPQHTDSALYPVISQLERAAEFERTDGHDTKWRKLSTLIGSATPEDLGLLADLLSVEKDACDRASNLTPQAKKEKTREVLLRQLELLSNQRPLLIIYEDVHWIDPSSSELLEIVIQRAARLPILLIIVFRPEFQPPWTGRPHLSTLVLNRLGEREGATLVQLTAGTRGLPTSVVADIVERTDGIPLFIEELTKAVLESASREDAKNLVSAVSLPTPAIPTTLHASLMARLDRLGVAAKEVAQMGAAIGREFSYEILAALRGRDDTGTRGALDLLVSAGLLFEHGSGPASSFLFKHALVQDIAYSTLLRSTRQALHGSISRVLMDRFPETMESKPEILAHHLEAAGQHFEAAKYLHVAGDRAIARSAIAEAITHLRKGLALMEGTDRPMLQADLLLSLATALMAAKGYAAQEAGQAFERASALCERMGDSNKLIRIRVGQWVQLHIGADERHALSAAQTLLRVAESTSLASNRALAHCCMGATSFHIGELTAARAHLQKSVELYDEQPAPLIVQDIAVSSLTYLSNTLVVLGQPELARSQISAAYSRANRLGHLPSLAFAHSVACRSFSLMRDFPRLSATAQSLLTLATEQQLPFWIAIAKIYCGWSEAENGRTLEGILSIQEGLAEFQAPGARFTECFWFGLLALAQAKAGEFAKASMLLDAALSSIEETEERWFEAEVHRLKGEIALTASSHRHSSKKAEDEFTTSLIIARRQNARLWELRASASLARLRRDQGKQIEGYRLLAPIFGSFSEGLDAPDMLEAKALLETLS